MDFPADKEERKAVVADLRRRVVELADAEAAFQLGRFNTRSTRDDFLDAADGWLVPEGGHARGTSWAWQAVDVYMHRDVTERYRQWMSRGMRLEFPPPIAPGITVDHDLFLVKGDEDGILTVDVTIQVRGPQPEAAAAALAVTRHRIGLTNEAGYEYGSSRRRW